MDDRSIVYLVFFPSISVVCPFVSVSLSVSVRLSASVRLSVVCLSLYISRSL